MTAIEFNNISKQYRLGLVSSGTIRADFQRWWTMNIRGKEDPFLKVGETNDRASKGNSEFVWALKDIDFKVEQGDVVGIIGKNGAGKSTLLKILSKVTGPTTGTIRAKGRIGSLLEVGTGFHPEMTGRENIYLNGAILGMNKQEISRKLDEIVDFSGCERYIDTPVKRYSSGMMVRLGFAVAAHLDPEILVVDEVLAVGDAEFQKKAIGKMQDVSRGEGRTVLFVSHNMVAVKALCKHGVLLVNGQVNTMGEIDSVVDKYLSFDSSFDQETIVDCIHWHNTQVQIHNISINNSVKNRSYIPQTQTLLPIEISGFVDGEIDTEVALIFRNEDGTALASFSYSNSKGALLRLSGSFNFSTTICLPKNLYSGSLIVDLYFHKPKIAFYIEAPHCCKLECEGFQNPFGQVTLQKRSGLMELGCCES